MTDKKLIKPHKGGRNAKIECRCTVAVKERFFEIAKLRGISTADLLEHWVKSAKD